MSDRGMMRKVNLDSAPASTNVAETHPNQKDRLAEHFADLLGNVNWTNLAESPTKVTTPKSERKRADFDDNGTNGRIRTQKWDISHRFAATAHGSRRNNV